MLNYDPSTYDSPTLPLDLGVAVTSENIDDLTAPVSNQNGSSKSTFQNAIDNVASLFHNGLDIYNSVQQTVGTAKAQAAAKKNAASQTVVVSPSNPSVVFGLSTPQILLVVGGLAALLIIPRLLRK